MHPQTLQTWMNIIVMHTRWHIVDQYILYPLTPVKRLSSCVIRATLVQLKWAIAERKAGAIIFILKVFLKNVLYLLLSLNAAELEA